MYPLLAREESLALLPIPAVNDTIDRRHLHGVARFVVSWGFTGLLPGTPRAGVPTTCLLRDL